MAYRVKRHNSTNYHINRLKSTLSPLNEGIYKRIHTVIHSKEANIEINGIKYPKLMANNGCRYIDYHDVKFMEQNHNTSSLWAKQAKNGRKITWGIRQGAWILIVDDGETIQK